MTSDPSHPPNSPRQLEPTADSAADQLTNAAEQSADPAEQSADPAEQSASAQVTMSTLGDASETPRDVSPAGEAASAALAASAAPVSVGHAAVARETWFRRTSHRELKLINHRLRQALLLQSVVASVVFGFWLLGKLSWNHDPLVSQRFRRAEVKVLSNRAQNAALQFHHDLTTGQFGQARLLATEGAESLVDEAAAACQPSAPCGPTERVFTRATLLRSLGQEAHARVESFTKDGTLVSEATYEVSHESGQWLVAGRSAP